MADTKVERREFDLPSGKKGSVIARAKGKHLRQASRIAGNGATQFDAVAAMIAVKCMIDGEPITTEEIDEMDEDDIAVLSAEATGGSKKKEPARGKASEATPDEPTTAASTSPSVT